MKHNKCIDCNKNLHPLSKYQGSIRCKSCARKYQYATRPETNPLFDKKGKNHYQWKGGKDSRKCYCIDCNKELNESAHYRKDKRCKSCYYKTLKGEGNPMFGIHRFGEKAPTWIDGRSFEPYTEEFNSELKELIRDRDNHECQNCSMTEEEHLIVRGRVLDIHHIDYDKKNCSKENLITLCNFCNIRANFNRDYWQELFMNKMEELCKTIKN